MIKTTLAALFVAAGLISSGAQAASISSYDVQHAQGSGFGGWSHNYSGAIVSDGAGAYNYTGGSGTLNDGFIPYDHTNNELFSLGNSPVITLHLNTTSLVSSIDLLGGYTGGNSIPGTINGVTVTIGSTSQAFSSSAWGPGCASGLCNDYIDLSSSSLSSMVTNTITLSNFTGGWFGYFSLGEIQVNGNAVEAIPEPETYAMLLAGLGLMGAVARRRKQQAAV